MWWIHALIDLVLPQVKLDVKRDSPPAATQDFPPAAKKIKVEPNSTELSDSGAAPIKESHLQLDDLPPELLPFHYENTLKKVIGKGFMLYLLYLGSISSHNPRLKESLMLET